MTIEERYTHWQEVIETQQTSGLSIVDYCRSRNMRTNIFYAWRRRLQKRQTDKRGFIELHSSSPVSVQDTGIRIVTAAGFHIEVCRGFDSITLCSVLTCLASR